VHVTLRSACRSLRTQFVFPTLRNAISAANRKAAAVFRIAQFSVQGDHLHLLVEAADRAALLHGVRALCIRIARRVNRLLGRRGRFFADRWHGRALTSPRAVRNALVYVLANFRKHLPGARAAIDPYSSAPYFEDFIEFSPGALTNSPSSSPPKSNSTPIAPARTWLLSIGWKRHGKLSVLEHPAQ
jgi:REP element-mobilizing transposase RayT